MLKTLRNAFKIKDVRNRILFTFMMLIVIRIGFLVSRAPYFRVG